VQDVIAERAAAGDTFGGTAGEQSSTSRINIGNAQRAAMDAGLQQEVREATALRTRQEQLRAALLTARERETRERQAEEAAEVQARAGRAQEALSDTLVTRGSSVSPRQREVIGRLQSAAGEGMLFSDENRRLLGRVGDP
jgi:hypothetical protein